MKPKQMAIIGLLIILMGIAGIATIKIVLHEDNDEPEMMEIEIDTACYDMIATFGNGWSTFNVIYDYYEYDGKTYKFFRDSVFYMEFTLNEKYNMMVKTNNCE